MRDQILFIEDGEIVERGTHEELLATSGRYKALYDLQVRPGDEAVSAQGGKMAEEMETERSDVREDGRWPPRAVVGSQRASRRRCSARPLMATSSNGYGPSSAVSARRRFSVCAVDVYADAIDDPADYPLRSTTACSRMAAIRH